MLPAYVITLLNKVYYSAKNSSGVLIISNSHIRDERHRFKFKNSKKDISFETILELVEYEQQRLNYTHYLSITALNTDEPRHVPIELDDRLINHLTLDKISFSYVDYVTRTHTGPTLLKDVW